MNSEELNQIKERFLNKPCPEPFRGTIEKLVEAVEGKSKRPTKETPAE